MSEDLKKNTHKKITIDAIAKELGCSKTTVSRALSGKGRISDGMRKRVLEYSEQCGYKPNSLAKGLADSKTYNIGVVLPDDQDLNEIPFFQNCLLGICETASGIGYDVVVVTVNSNDISRLKNVVEKHKVDGIILTRSLVEDPSVEYLLEQQIPFLVVGSYKNPNVLQIDNHHVEACRELTSLLLTRRANRIAFIGGDLDHMVSQKRFAGFKEGMAIHQHTLKDELIFLNCNTKTLVDQAVEKILECQADCILCMDDKICVQVLMKLNEEHLSIPRDIKVASFYDNLFLQCHNPSITALQFDERELGRVACKMIFGLLFGKEIRNKVYLGYDIVLRPSTKQSNLLSS